MARLTFYGAVGSVTGSRFLLEVDQRKILVDCGMFQGTKENRLRNWDRFPVPPKDVDSVLLTHAHIDHAGNLPRLVNQGFRGPIHCTRATADLCRIMLMDTAHIQEEDARWANKKGFSRHKPALPLFTVPDAEKALLQLKPWHYGEQLDLNSQLRVKFKDAGHLLGSSMIDIRRQDNKRQRKILFCGDIGRAEPALLRDPVQVYNIDYLIVESTYGDRLHEDDDPRRALARVIRESIERGGVLLIPSFAVGRTQTLLYLLRQLQEDKLIPDVPIFVDSPLACDATTIYERRIADQKLSVRAQAVKGKRVFRPHNLELCDSRQESKGISAIQSSAIIISSSGMATAGRVLHHMVQRLPYEQNTVLFIGYQAEGTRGRAIVEGEKVVKIHGEMVPVRAKVESISAFSGHADYDEILAWLMGFDRAPERVFIVHGEPAASQSLASKIRQQFGWNVVVPAFGDSFELDL